MKFLSRLLLFCLLAWGSALAQTGLPLCQGNDSSNWSSCRGTYSFLDGSKYSGEFKAGNFGGFGTFYYANGSVYIGEWFNGNRNGNGSLTYRNGSKYVGEWRDGFQNGMGVEYTAEGRVLASGTYLKGKNNASYAIDSSRFPFNAETPANLGLQANLAQSNLNACQGSDQKKWHLCTGTEDYESGVLKKFVGIYIDGERNGVGIEYARDGSVLRSGTWKGFYRLVTSHAVDTQKFPFNTSALAAVTPTYTPDLGKTERDRLTAEVEAERKKRQELEQQLVAAKERERITAELDLERKKRQELEAQLAASVQTTQTTQSQSNASRRSAHALVIGNAAYPGSGRLDNPVNDANAISQKLRSMGFTVTTITDANRQRLVQSMTQFRHTAASADISLLYYAGHGVQIFGTNYILPTDVDQTDPAQATIQGAGFSPISCC